MNAAITRALHSWISVGFAVIVGAAATFLALTLAGAVPGLNDGESGGGGGKYDGSPLLTSGRDRLAICVEVIGLAADVGPPMETAGRDAIQEAITETARTHPAWAMLGLSDPSPVVDIGCPTGPALYDPETAPVRTRPIEELWNIAGRSVADASPYRVHVYILPESVISTAAGPDGYRVTTEEVMWDVDVASPVTAGVYLSPADLGDKTLVLESIDDAIGLESDR